MKDAMRQDLGNPVDPLNTYPRNQDFDVAESMSELVAVCSLKKKVVNELASFLNVVPQQINSWDRKVVDYLVQNPDVFIEFKNSCHYNKWEIYQAIRFDGKVADSQVNGPQRSMSA
jgi:hypothetical protein